MNTAQKVLGAAFLMIFFISIGVIIGWNAKEAQLKQYPIHVLDRDEPKTYTKTIVREFHPGDTVSSKENGALILWEEWMGEEMIVGVITDSGTVKVLK